MWEDGQTPADAARIWKDTSITKRVSQYYSMRLGAHWSINTQTPIALWFENVAAVRNRVLHGGRIPTTSEVETAVDAANRLYESLARRLVANWKKYPRTMSVFVARALLGSIGVFPENESGRF